MKAIKWIVNCVTGIVFWPATILFGVVVIGSAFGAEFSLAFKQGVISFFCLAMMSAAPYGLIFRAPWLYGRHGK